MRKFVFFILAVSFFSCREESFEISSEDGSPIFNFQAEVDGALKSASAGVDDYYMYTEYQGLELTNLSESGKELFIGALRDESDQTFDISWQLVNAASILESNPIDEINLAFETASQGLAIGNEVVSISQPNGFGSNVNWYIDGVFAGNQAQTFIPYPSIPDSLNVEVRMDIVLDDYFEASITGRIKRSDFCSTILTVKKMEDENRLEFSLSPSGYGQTTVVWDANMESNLILLKALEPQPFGVNISGDQEDCKTRIEGEIKTLDFEEIRVGFTPVFGLGTDDMTGVPMEENEPFVRMFYKDENGVEYHSDAIDQNGDAFFNINQISDYIRNQEGFNTKIIDASFNLQMIDPSTGKIIQITNGVANFAVAIP